MTTRRAEADVRSEYVASRRSLDSVQFRELVGFVVQWQRNGGAGFV